MLCSPSTDEIVCEFSLRVKANSLHPEVCNDDSVREQLALLAATYKDLNGYQELAYRYAKIFYWVLGYGEIESAAVLLLK